MRWCEQKIGLDDFQSLNEAAISGKADVCKHQGCSLDPSEDDLDPHSLMLFCVPAKACELRKVTCILASTHDTRAVVPLCGFWCE